MKCYVRYVVTFECVQELTPAEYLECRADMSKLKAQLDFADEYSSVTAFCPITKEDEAELKKFLAGK